MTPSNLLAVARELVMSTRGRPRQANVCRAVSTTYYALFHCLAGCCADSLVGRTEGRHRDPAWNQVYRALEHGTARRRCQQASGMHRFPMEVRNFADLFVDLQEKRHKADYDPDAVFSKLLAVRDIYRAEEAISNFHKVPLSVRKAFAVYVLFAIRNR